MSKGEIMKGNHPRERATSDYEPLRAEKSMQPVSSPTRHSAILRVRFSTTTSEFNTLTFKLIPEEVGSSSESLETKED